jgi:peptidoglycan lytic transglycosylase G
MASDASARPRPDPSKFTPPAKPAFLSKPSFLSKPPPFPQRPARGGLPPGGKPGEPPIGKERPEAAPRHRIASGLPPQPPPLPSRKGVPRRDIPPLGAPAAKGDAKVARVFAKPSHVQDANPFSAVKAALQGILGSAKSPAADNSPVPGGGKPAPEHSAPLLAKAAGQSAPSAPGAAKPAAKPWPLPPRPVKAAGEATPAVVAPARANINPSTSEPAGSSAAKPPISDATMLGKVTPATAPGRPAAGSGPPAQGTPGRVVLGAGEPEPPISERLIDTLGPSLMEQKRITPRSPRAAIEPEQVRMPSRNKRASRRARNPLVIIGNAVFTVLLLVLLVGGGVIVIGKSRFEAPGPLSEDKVVNIPLRSGMLDIADLLTREGVLAEHRIIFIGGVFALKARGELKAGEYLFQKHASVRDVVETIVSGKVVQHQITVPEGLTSEQVVARLLENDILSGNIKDIPREGSLLPDSYYFHRGFMRDQMVRRMQEARNRLVDEVWGRRNPDLPLKTPEQLVILASIVEKETGKPEERTRIAAVFINRLRQKMRLQSDPTIIYGLVFGKGSLGRPLTRADIAHPTPYNTYVIDGLPPGPITNPGRASLEAVANPARTKELYFAADGSGGHAFAETYEQHQKNVARLRVIEQELKEPPAQNAQTPARAPSPPHRPRRNSSRSAGAR